MTNPRRVAHDLTDLSRAVGGHVLRRIGRTAARFHEETPLPVDVLESEDAYLVVFDAPGAKQSDVQVASVDGAVEVRIDRFREFRSGFDMVFPGRGMALDGRAALPNDADVDESAATATLEENGTLHVHIPKVVSAGLTDDPATQESNDPTAHQTADSTAHQTADSTTHQTADSRDDSEAEE